MTPWIISNAYALDRLVESANKKVFDSNNLALQLQAVNPSIPTNNGLGRLEEATYCQVHHELNGEDELELRYPVSGGMFDRLQLRNIIVAKADKQRGNQPYRIYSITKPLSGIVTAYARHLAYDLDGVVVEPYTASTITEALAGLKSHAMTGNPFTFTTTRTTSANFTVKVPSSVRSLMGGRSGSLLDVYGGEYTFDEYTVSLENSVGQNRGVSVRYGVNMLNLEQEENCANCYTGIVAYWTKENEPVIYSPVYVASNAYGYVKVLTVDMSDKWDSVPTQAALNTAAKNYIVENQIGVPKVSWTVDFVPLEDTEEYKNIAALEQVNIGDTVNVVFEKFGINASARVREVTWDVLKNRYVSVRLGSPKTNAADTIAAQNAEISKLLHIANQR